MSTSDSRISNFGAGPSSLPTSVLSTAAQGLLNFNSTGMGIAEISHRSKEFTAFLTNLTALITAQLQIPSTHTVLFTQGGGTGQFSTIVLNMLARHTLLFPNAKAEDRALDYVVTGSWSKKAAAEARRLTAQHAKVNIVTDARPYSKTAKSFDNIPAQTTYAFSPNPALIYYCDNETVDGVQFSADDASPQAFPFHLLPNQNTLIPLVADYSSSFMSRPIPHLADHAIIYAGAQKNVGPAGLTILIVRNDCIVDVDAAAQLGSIPVPITMSYKTLADSKSLYNTPPVLSIYICGLVIEQMGKNGGLAYYEDLNRKKQALVYGVLTIGEDKGVLKGKVAEGSGSWMNVVFDVLGEGKEELFVKGAEAKGMKGLKGHRSVGGIRVSLYNAVTLEQTEQLVAYIQEFIEEHTPKADAPEANTTIAAPDA